MGRGVSSMALIAASRGLALATVKRLYSSGVPMLPFQTPGITWLQLICAVTVILDKTKQIKHQKLLYRTYGLLGDGSNSVRIFFLVGEWASARDILKTFVEARKIIESATETDLFYI